MSLSSGRGASPPRQLSERPAAGRPPTLSFASRLRAAFGRREPDAAREAVLAERLEILLDIAKGLSRTLDRREIFRTIVVEANRVLGTDAATIRIVRDATLEVVAWAGISDDDAARLPAFRDDEGWFARVLRTGRPLAWENISDPEPPGYERYPADMRFAADLIVPLIHRDEVIGTLSCVSKSPRRWTDDDIAFVAGLATHAAVALHNAELFEEAESREARFRVLQVAASRMNRAKTLESVGRAVVEETRRILDYHNARVYVVQPTGDVVPIAFEGTVGEYEKVDFALLRTSLGVGFTGWVAERGVPLLIHDANADPRGETIPGTADIDESMMVVPMRYDEEVVGVIALSKLGLRQFDEDDLQMLTILADHAATALESARLLTRSEGVTVELQRLVEMSSALSRSLDPRQVANLIAEHIARCAISYWDRAAGRVLTLGYYPAAGITALDPFFDISSFPETVRVLERQVTSIVDAADPAADAAEVALLKRDGKQMVAMLPLVAKGQSIGLVELLSATPFTLDESGLALARTMANEAAMALENARLYEDARNLADRDPLTGFYNHRYLHERLGEEVVRAQRSRRPLGVLMIDLDDFKLVNDTFGHLFGDRVLAWTAERIRSTLRAPDVAARYGGDEFAVILPEADPAAAESAAQRILAAFNEPFHAEARGQVPIAVSIGIATHPVDGRTGTELIAAADRRLYRVKESGGHSVATTDPTLPVRPPKRSAGAA
ncbi:MAG: diguanylate cyclase [Chloroflexi bacterium]|nr:MAG: diguanylate cyclase [Chloroflexota bacterium]